MAPNTPGSKVPSHGTDRLATTYAIDLIQVDWNRLGNPSYRSGFLKYFLTGLPLTDFYCWGQPVYAPVDGVIIQALDGTTEREPVHWLRDGYHAAQISHRKSITNDIFRKVAGNHIVIQHSNQIFVALVHMKNGSVRVKIGDRVEVGDIVGEIGHSGNSMIPHLHMQVMDQVNAKQAKGLPFVFRKYEIFRAGHWQKVCYSLPKSDDHIRCLA